MADPNSHIDAIGRFFHKRGVPSDHILINLHDPRAHGAIDLLVDAYIDDDPRFAKDLKARLRTIQSGPATHGGFDTEMLYCPECRNTHRDIEEWAKRLHHTHVCLYCGYMWRLDRYVFGSLKDISAEEMNHAHAQNLIVQTHGVRALREQFLKENPNG